MDTNNEYKNDCIGCENIDYGSFPFNEKEDANSNKKGFYIDTEGCGIVQEGNYWLEIFYCPVCGRKIV